MDPTKPAFTLLDPPTTTPRSPINMRAPRSRPHSLHAVQGPMQTPVQQQQQQQQGRKIFNCIVDDSALVAGVKRSTRNGIRQWVKNGQIRLFVPLHALEQLSRQRSATTRHGDDVRETLQWLDDATSKFPNIVTLQGADETYENWADVEKFAVPRTLFSEYDALDDAASSSIHDSPNLTLSKLSLDDQPARHTPLSSAASDASHPLSPSSMRSQRSSLSAMSPPTSPVKGTSSPVKASNAEPDERPTSSTGVPTRLQQLLNYILWRIHQEQDPIAALESFIFLCNDESKVNFARGFDIKTKRLEHMREAISREDRDFRNRQSLVNRESQPPASAPAVTPSLNQAKSVDNDDDDEEEVVFAPAPPKAPAAMLSKQNSQRGRGASQSNVLDPDAFDRRAPIGPVAPQVYRADNTHASFAPRGHSRGNFRAGPRARGGYGSGAARRGGGGGAAFPGNDAPAPGGQIDPNSFARPRSNGYTGRGGRKLWVPS